MTEYRPEWACNNYGNYGHDWMDCHECLESYDEYCNEDVTWRFIDVPKYHEGKRVIESNLEICPLCRDTKTVSTPLQTIKMIIDPEYRTECHKCKVWWYTYRTEFRS